MLRYTWATVLYALGGLCRTGGNLGGGTGLYRLAARLMGRAGHVDPRLRDARRDRAVLLWRELGREDEALTALSELLDEDPSDSVALLNRALAAFELARYQAALNDLETWLAHPQRDAVYLDIALRYRNQLRELIDPGTAGQPLL